MDEIKKELEQIAEINECLKRVASAADTSNVTAIERLSSMGVGLAEQLSLSFKRIKLLSRHQQLVQNEPLMRIAYENEPNHL